MSRIRCPRQHKQSAAAEDRKNKAHDQHMRRMEPEAREVGVVPDSAGNERQKNQELRKPYVNFRNSRYVYIDKIGTHETQAEETDHHHQLDHNQEREEGFEPVALQIKDFMAGVKHLYQKLEYIV